MTSPESNIHPRLYDDIYYGFKGIAAARGTINYDPLDRSMEPGNDGTVTAEGERAYCHVYELEAGDLSQDIRDKGINGVGIESYTSQVYDGSIWPERVAILLRDTQKITRVFRFEKTADVVKTAEIFIYVDDDGDNADDQKRSVGIELTDDKKDQIIDDIFHRRTHWLQQEGPAGEFARSVHTVFNIRLPKPDAGDIALLRSVLATL